MGETLDVWFKREILIHEAALLRYLHRTWRRGEEIHDLRQEIYIRVYEAADRELPQSPRSFLFATARHLVTDRLRRSKVISIEAVGDFDVLNVVADDISPERRLDSRQQLKRLAQALNELPRKCREVVWLRRIDGLSQKQVAHRLGISERTVESHILKGMRLLANTLFGNTAGPASKDRTATDEDGSGHGKQHTD